MPTAKGTHKKIIIEDSDSDTEVDQLDESQYGGGPGSRNTTPRRPRRPSATPPPLPTPTRLRSSITQTSRAQDGDVLGRAVRHRANQVPPHATPAPEAAEDVPALPTNPMANDNVGHPAAPPARPQSEEFIVHDPIDHLIHLADESQPGGNIVAPGVTDAANDGEPGSKSTAPSHDDSVEHSDEPDQALADDDGVPMKRGRRSNEASAALDAVCSNAIKMLESTAHEYGLAPEQVFAHFHKVEQRLKTTENPWNIYQRYFRHFLEEETSRLPEDVQSTIQASGGRVSNAITKQCWELFRKVHGDKHMEILQKFDDLHHAGPSDQTVGQREKLFNKLCDQIEGMISREARRHGFEFVVLAGGNNINQDGGLARLIESNGAKGFFEAKCRYSTHEAIGHLKAHIYGLASEAHVLATFGARNEMSHDTPTAPLGQKGDKATIKTPATTDSVPAVTGPLTQYGRLSPYVKAITCDNPKDRESRLKYLKAQITSQLGTLGVKWRSDHLFPWKNMVSELAKAGVMVFNWPEDCRHPGRTPKESNKGIAELTAPEQILLMDALVAPHRLHFTLLEDEDKRKGLLSGKRPVIVGIPPHPSSRHERGLMVYVGGRYDFDGRKRRTEEEVMIQDVDTALKDNQAAGTKHKRNTRSSAKAKVPDACPNPTHDDFETVLMNGDPVEPPAKAKKKARVSSKPYIEISEDEGVPANPADASPHVVPVKTGVKRRAAKKVIVEPSDDEDEVIELPKDPEDVGKANKGKRKQQDTTDDAAASGHQPKRPRPTPCQTNMTDADNGEGDTLEDDMFNRASARARGQNKRHSTVGDDSERALTPFGERHRKANDERAPVAESERVLAPPDERPRRIDDENERAPMPKDGRHGRVDGERALTPANERAPVTDERAPTDENERAPTPKDAVHGERALTPGDERAPLPKNASHRSVNGGRALTPGNVIANERALVDDNERAPVSFTDEEDDKAERRHPDLSNGRAHAAEDEGVSGITNTSDPQPAVMMAATPAGHTAPAYQPLPAVQNVGWPAGGASYPPPSSLLFSPNVATHTPLSPGMTPTNGLMHPGQPFHSHVNANVPMPPPSVPSSYPPNILPDAYMSWQRYTGMFGFPFYPGMPGPGYPSMAAQQQQPGLAAHQQHHGFPPYQPAGTAYPGTPMLPPAMLPPAMQGSSDPSQQLPPQAPGA